MIPFNPLQGVLPVLHTPYTDDYRVDFDTLHQELDFAYEQGADGVVFALASELLRLTESERRSITELLGRDTRGPVIISVGAETTFHATQYARHAEGCGASAVMATPPLTTRAGESELVRYFAAIVEATTVPVIVQDASSYVGAPLSTAFQINLYRRFGARIAFKPEADPVGPVITAINENTGGDAAIYEGSGGAMLVENCRRGISGTIPGTDLIDAIVALWRAIQEGDEDRIYRISPLIGAIQALGIGLDGYLTIEKRLLYRRGIFKNILVRGPVAFQLDAPAEQELYRLYDRLQENLK